MTSATARPVTFGIKTSQSNVAWPDILRVWHEADATPEIAHAWLFDHLLPIYGDLDGTMLEGWTLLAALAAQTERLGLGLIVTSNRFRPPALLAKIAATVDVVAGGGRLTLGLGVGSNATAPLARKEYEAHGLPFLPPRDAIASLDEACTIITRLWTEDAPFDVAGAHHTLVGARCNPRPAVRPPLLIGGWGARTLRVVARHADIWNLPGAPLHDADELVRRSQTLDEACREVGRDPAAIERSVQLGVDYADLAATRDAARAAIAAGFTHVVLALSAPYPEGIAGMLRDAIIRPATG